MAPSRKSEPELAVLLRRDDRRTTGRVIETAAGRNLNL